uniref:hypothetical protein n=1 Tax=Marinobacterium profundum TaxID=1714300 RepID=UPI001C1F7F30
MWVNRTVVLSLVTFFARAKKVTRPGGRNRDYQKVTVVGCFANSCEGCPSLLFDYQNQVV